MLITRILPAIALVAFSVPMGILVADTSVDEVRPLGNLETLIGGQDATKFQCEDVCLNGPGATGGACAAAVCANGGGSVAACGPSFIGYVCGEVRLNKEIRLECVANPAGPKDPCVNGPNAHCIQYRLCLCGAGPAFTCAVVGGAPQNCGQANPSANCP